MEKDTSIIFIVKHKEYNNPIPKNYKEIYVGDMFKKNDDNINYLNPYINEATAIYDIWKHFKGDIMGLCHYRRYFYEDDILSLKSAKNVLKTHDIIITKDVIFDKGIYKQLSSEFTFYDRLILDKYYNILIKKEPQLEEWFRFNHFSPKEMFVCKKELLDQYCEWLFPLIIPITEQFVKEDVDMVSNKRMIGHLVERLFAYWIWKNSLKCYRMEYVDL